MDCLHNFNSKVDLCEDNNSTLQSFPLYRILPNDLETINKPSGHSCVKQDSPNSGNPLQTHLISPLNHFSKYPQKIFFRLFSTVQKINSHGGMRCAIHQGTPWFPTYRFRHRPLCLNKEGFRLSFCLKHFIQTSQTTKSPILIEIDKTNQNKKSLTTRVKKHSHFP